MEEIAMGLRSIMNLKQDKHKENHISRFSIVRWSETKDKGKTFFKQARKAKHALCLNT